MADVRDAVRILQPQTGRNGETYFHFKYQIELLFGLTEHKAQICWNENVGAFPVGYETERVMASFCRVRKSGEYQIAVVINNVALFSENSL